MQLSTLHVAVDITNIDSAVAFHGRAFGIPAIKRRPGDEPAVETPGGGRCAPEPTDAR